jgi:hypothetical protein
MRPSAFTHSVPTFGAETECLAQMAGKAVHQCLEKLCSICPLKVENLFDSVGVAASQRTRENLHSRSNIELRVPIHDVRSTNRGRFSEDTCR